MEIDKSDELFRKKLEHYSESPPPEVWTRIESSLNKKKGKRVLPLWITVGGVAAILVIGLMILGPQNNTKQKIQNSISGTEAKSGKTNTANPGDLDLPVEKSGFVVEENQNTVSNKSGGKTSWKIGGENYSSPVAEKNDTDFNFLNIESLANTQKEKQEGKSEQEIERSVESSIKSTETASSSNSVIESAENPFDENQNLEVKSTKIKGKWSLGPQVAPVYYGWVGNGSPIAASFAGNSKAGLTNLSYGLTIAYTINPKVSLRSGINRVELGYQTNDVAFTSSFVSRPSSLIRTINYSENSKNVVVHSTLPNSESVSTGVISDLLVPSPEREGQMVQQFGYLEVPLEVQFALVQKNWGLNLIGGMSSLFLLDNSVSLDAEGNSLEIGQASNMNSLNFSSNIGLGAYYKIHQDVEFTLQPMFKWHLNAFSETAGQFRPYTMGVYSGLSFKF